MIANQTHARMPFSPRFHGSAGAWLWLLCLVLRCSALGQNVSWNLGVDQGYVGASAGAQNLSNVTSSLNLGTGGNLYDANVQGPFGSEASSKLTVDVRPSTNNLSYSMTWSGSVDAGPDWDKPPWIESASSACQLSRSMTLTFDSTVRWRAVTRVAAQMPLGKTFLLIGSFPGPGYAQIKPSDELKER